MKKTTILFILLSGIIVSAKNNAKMIFKSGVEVQTAHKGKKNFAKGKHKAVDLTLSSADSNLRFNLVIQGDRQNIFRPSYTESYTPIKLQHAPEVIIEENEKEDDLFGGTFTEKCEIYYGEKYCSEDTEQNNIYNKPENNYVQEAPSHHIENSFFQTLNPNFNGHSHNHDHDHDHTHNHGHNHTHDEHEHFGRRTIFNKFTPKIRKINKDSNDLQSKASLEYNDGLNMVKYTQYFTNFKEGESTHFKGESIIEGRNTKLINDNFAVSIAPRFNVNLYTKNSILADLDLDLRYKKDNDTTLGAYLYNGVQLAGIDEKLKYLNKGEIFYDYNTEYHKHHKFYEILDHEHEKRDQFKVKLGLTHIAENEKHLFNDEYLKEEYKTKENKYVAELDLKMKKSDIFTKNLVLENNLNIKRNYKQKSESGKVYRATFEYKFKNDGEKVKVIESPEYLSDKYKVDEKLYKNDNSLELHTIYNQEVPADDLLGTEAKKIKYIKIIKAELSDSTGLLPAEIENNNIEISNDTSLKYKKNGYKIETTNKLKTKNVLTNGEAIVENETKIEGSKDVHKNINIKLKALNEYKTLIKNNENKYKLDLLTLGFDTKFKLDFNNFKLRTGLEFDFGIQNRKAKEERLLATKHKYLLDEEILSEEDFKIAYPKADYKEYRDLKDYTKNIADSLRKQLKEENNQWVHGHEINMKPYIKLRYLVNKNMNIDFKGEANILFKKDNFLRLYSDFTPKTDKTEYIGTGTKFSIDFKYKY